MLPIKDRINDVIPLCNYYLNKYNRNKMYKLLLSKNSIRKLESYSWPGNVRQISNYMERLVILNQNHNIKKDYEISDVLNDMDEIENISFNKNDSLELNIKEARERFEKEYFLSQIKRFNGNILKVSEITGMERTALYRKLKLLNIHLNKN